ncbi:MAG TPA: DUF202 domain-containing protein [Candidatus Dormibacteraeota bacterium]
MRTRDHLANVRTLLAWNRTGLALLVLAVVVDKLQALVRGGHVVSVGSTGADRPAATLLAVLGVAVCGGSFLRFELARHAIERGVFRPRVAPDLVLLGLVAVATVVLTVAVVHV